MSRTLDAMQLDVDRWIRDIGGGYFSELTNMCLLAEETGELARVIARIYGDQVAKRGDLSDPDDARASVREERPESPLKRPSPRPSARRQSAMLRASGEGKNDA